MLHSVPELAATRLGARSRVPPLGNVNTARNAKLLSREGWILAPSNTLGNASLNEPADLRSFTLANQTGRVENPCVRSRVVG